MSAVARRPEAAVGAGGGRSEVGRRPYLDGLRGVAACMVFFAHLMIAVLPSVVTFNRGEAHVYRLEKSLGLSPLGWLWNGEYAVCIFFVLSGFVLSEFCLTTRISFPAQVVRRYLRLAVPMLITSFFAYLIMKLGLYKNLDAATQVTKSGWLSMWYRAFEPNLFGMAKEALYSAFVDGRANYNSNLWTMRIELIGSVTIFVIFALLRNVYVRGVALVVYALSNPTNYYGLFAVGALLYDFEAPVRAFFVRAVRDERLREQIALLVFVLGVFMGSYPHIQPGMVAPAHFFLTPRIPTLGWHELGAMLTVGALLFSTPAQRWLGGTFGRYLGKLSFVLYLIHLPILCSFTAWLTYGLGSTPYWFNLPVTVVSTIAVVFGVSTWLYRFVDIRTTVWSREAGLAVDRFLSTARTRPFSPALEGRPA